MIYNFDENEMPYGILERFGLTQEMIEDLPTDICKYSQWPAFSSLTCTHHC